MAYDHSEIGEVLVLVGGILAVVLSLVPLIIVLVGASIAKGLLFSLIGIVSGGSLPPVLSTLGDWMTGVVALWVMLSGVLLLVLGIVALYAFSRIRQGDFRSGGIIAIIVGVIMLATTYWLPGILTLVGGALCYISGQ